MQSLLSGNELLVVAALTLVAVLLLLEASYLFWTARHGKQAKRMRTRLQEMSGMSRNASARLVKGNLFSTLPSLDRYLRSAPILRSLERYVMQSGLRWTVMKVLVICALTGIVAAVLVMQGLRQGVLVSAVAGTACAGLPLLYVHFRRSRRLAKIQAQLPDALDLMTRALRAGHAFTAAIKMVTEEMQDPIASEFRAMHDEVSFGISMQEAMVNFSDRVPLGDLRYFVVASLVQRESGGNLTEVFTNLSRLIRERGKLHAKVKVLSSEGRLSAWVMSLMPFALGGLLYAFNPKFMGPLFTDPIGQTIVGYLLPLMALGVLVTLRLVRIRY